MNLYERRRQRGLHVRSRLVYWLHDHAPSGVWAVWKWSGVVWAALLGRPIIHGINFTGCRITPGSRSRPLTIAGCVFGASDHSRPLIEPAP